MEAQEPVDHGLGLVAPVQAPGGQVLEGLQDGGLRELVEAELREGCSDGKTLTEELQFLLRIAAANVPGLLAASPR